MEYQPNLKEVLLASFNYGLNLSNDEENDKNEKDSRIDLKQLNRNFYPDRRELTWDQFNKYFKRSQYQTIMS